MRERLRRALRASALDAGLVSLLGTGMLLMTSTGRQHLAVSASIACLSLLAVLVGGRLE